MRRQRLFLSAVALVLVAGACGDSVTETLPSERITTTTPAPGTTVPPTLPGPGEPLQGVIPTEDGMQLESLTYIGGPDWVVLAHMRPADMTSWLPFGEVLRDEGYTALAFNFRGYGNSTGEQEPFAVDTDVVAAIDFALARGAERIFVIGASMGGTGALVAAAKRDVTAVATLSAPDVFFDADAIGAVPDITARMLLVAAEGDGPYPGIVTDFAAVARDAEVRIFAGNAHGTALFDTHGDELTALLLDFLAAA